MIRTNVVPQMLVALLVAAAPFGGCAVDTETGLTPEGSESQPPVSVEPAAAPEAPTTAEAEAPATDEPATPSTSSTEVTSPPAAPDKQPAVEVREAGFFIDPEKSVLIRDPAIVDNGTRTLDPCDARRRGIPRGPVSSAQTWTFGHLLTQMANGRDPAVFAQNWLANWAISTRINDDDLIALRARTHSITTLPGRIYDVWQRESGGTAGGNVQLAMNRAPFRLLAIVNRFDLRKNRRFNEGNSGELRFIFSVLDPDRMESNQQSCMQAVSIDAPNTGTPGDQLLILEYAVDHLSDSTRRDWILSWTALTNLSFTDAGFAPELERLTQTVVRAGAGGSRPNGSALIRIRTNESTNAVHWDLREFTINATTGFLVPTTIKQTPKALFTPQFAEPGLVSWVSANGPTILNDTHRVPDQLLGTHSINQASGSSWVFPLTSQGIDPLVAYEFSRQTCVGCHSADTGSSFFHVHGRPFRQTSPISHFLDGQWPDAPAGCPSDPNGQPRCFNEFESRTNDILSYLNGGG